jgi:hypothetical protein
LHLLPLLHQLLLLPLLPLLHQLPSSAQFNLLTLLLQLNLLTLHNQVHPLPLLLLLNHLPVLLLMPEPHQRAHLLQLVQAPLLPQHGPPLLLLLSKLSLADCQEIQEPQPLPLLHLLHGPQELHRPVDQLVQASQLLPLLQLHLNNLLVQQLQLPQLPLLPQLHQLHHLHQPLLLLQLNQAPAMDPSPPTHQLQACTQAHQVPQPVAANQLLQLPQLPLPLQLDLQHQVLQLPPTLQLPVNNLEHHQPLSLPQLQLPQLFLPLLHQSQALHLLLQFQPQPGQLHPSHLNNPDFHAHHGVQPHQSAQPHPTHQKDHGALLSLRPQFFHLNPRPQSHLLMLVLLQLPLKLQFNLSSLRPLQHLRLQSFQLPSKLLMPLKHQRLQSCLLPSQHPWSPSHQRPQDHQ